MTRRSRRMALLGMLAGLCVGAGAAGQAYAQDPGSPGTASQPGSGSSCVVTGRAFVQKDAEIYDAAAGGNKIAVFSGALAPLKATNFPADAATGRVQINTAGGFRVEGFTDPRAITVFATRDLPVVSDRLWISSGVPLKVIGAAPGKIRVELTSGAGLSAPIRGWAPCDSLTFDKGRLPLYEVPGNARGYVAKSGMLDLYDAPGGSVVHSVAISGDGNGLLLWGTQTRSGYAHVTSRSDIFIDAWVKVSEVRALPRGEMMDQLAPGERIQNPPQLALKDYLRLMNAPSTVSIFAGRGATFPTIGAVESGAEIYVIETVVGWASVLPKSLHVMPVGDRAFWVRASDLGLATPGGPDAGAGAR